MAISGHLDHGENDTAADREPRRTLFLEALGSRETGEAAAVLIHNVSSTGLLLETADTLHEGERLTIDLPEAGPVAARVVWASGKLYGCQFHEPLTAAALSATQLRSATGQSPEIGPRALDMPDAPFNVQVQKLRKASGLTLSQLATKLGVSKPTVWAWEQGKAKPVESRIEALADALGVEPATLRSGQAETDLSRLIATSREQIARAIGTSPDSVRIMIDL